MLNDSIVNEPIQQRVKNEDVSNLDNIKKYSCISKKVEEKKRRKKRIFLFAAWLMFLLIVLVF